MINYQPSKYSSWLISLSTSTSIKASINDCLYSKSAIKDQICIEIQLYNLLRHKADYIGIERGSGCSSAVGVRGGRQRLKLGTNCANSVGTPIHEFMHAIGNCDVTDL